MLLATMLLLAPAFAQDACELCLDLDATEERCEAEFGDGHVVCEAIGTAEEACPQYDEGEPDDDDDDDDAEGAPGAECPDLCGDVPGLLETCASALGAAHRVCAELQDLSEECGAGSSSSLASCSVLGAAGGGGLVLALGLLALRRRRA